MNCLFLSSATYEGVLSQVELNYTDMTPGGAPVERPELRATDPYSVIFTFDIEGCTEVRYEV